MTVTAGLQQTVQNAGVGIIFLPLCDALSCTHTSAKFSLAFSLQVFFSCTVTPPLSAQVLFLKNNTKASFFPLYSWHPNSDLELQCMQTSATQ